MMLIEQLCFEAIIEDSLEFGLGTAHRSYCYENRINSFKGAHVAIEWSLVAGPISAVISATAGLEGY